jgi:hypothetical protein
MFCRHCKNESTKVYRHFYCSETCWKAWKRLKKLSEEKIYSPEKGMLEKVTLANATRSDIRAAKHLTPKKPHSRFCSECHKIFYPEKTWQRFCSDTCRKLWHSNEKARDYERQAEIIDQLEKENASLRAELVLYKTK